MMATTAATSILSILMSTPLARAEARSGCHVINSVCRENIPGRRSSLDKLYFKYHEVEGSEDFEYTPCAEMLNSSWY